MASLSIGEMASLLNVSRRTLRYYEELGIVQPKARGTQNNYRYYDTNDVNKIKAVIMLKDSGLSLKEIAETLGKGFNGFDSDEFITGQMMAEKIFARLLEQRDKLREKLTAMRETLNNVEKSINSLEVCLKCCDHKGPEHCSQCDEGAEEVVDAAQQKIKESSQLHERN